MSDKFIKYIDDTLRKSKNETICKYYNNHESIYDILQHNNVSEASNYLKKIVSFTGKIAFTPRQLADYMIQVIKREPFAYGDYILLLNTCNLTSIVGTPINFNTFSEAVINSYYEKPIVVSAFLENSVVADNTNLQAEYIDNAHERVRTLCEENESLKSFITVVNEYYIRAQPLVISPVNSLTHLFETIPRYCFHTTALANFYNIYKHEPHDTPTALQQKFISLVTCNITASETILEHKTNNKIADISVDRQIEELIDRIEYTLSGWAPSSIASRVIDLLNDLLDSSKTSIETPVNNEDNELHKTEQTNSLIDEITADNRMPVAKPDERFNHRMKLVDVYKNTIASCELMRSSNMGGFDKLTESYLITSGGISGLASVTSNVINSDYCDDVIPIKTFNRNSTLEYNGLIKLVCGDAIDYIADNRAVYTYILGGSTLASCNNAENGILTPESHLTYRTSYSIAMKQLLNAYPLRKREVVYVPYVLLFTDADYKKRTSNFWKLFSVINNGLPINSLPQEYPFVKQRYIDACELALFLGKRDIVFDDGDLLTTGLSSLVAGNIIASVAKLYQNKFSTITVCVCPTIYESWKSYFP